MDANGNRLPEHSDLDALLDNRLPFWGDRHYQYDAYGNLITIKRGQNQALVQALTYNAKHQLIELTETHHGQFHQTLIFDYDALGRRIWKKVYQQTPNQESYDRAEQTIWHGSQRIQTRYFSDKRRCIHHDITLYEPGSHTPLAMLDNTLGLLDIDTDHLGTPKALYDRKTGNELWTTDHTLYGQTKNNTSHNTHPKTGQPLDPKLRFQGQYEDLETGLYQNLNRYYDPHSGRYINHDPIGLLGGLNQYQYCPNPVEWIDPLGLRCKEFAKNPKGAHAIIEEKWNYTMTPKDMKELQATIDRIKLNNPRYSNDGTTFSNIHTIGNENSQRLDTGSGPYKEWTVKTPNTGGNGARRIVVDTKTGKAFYTHDHYNSFIEIDLSGWK